MRIRDANCERAFKGELRRRVNRLPAERIARRAGPNSGTRALVSGKDSTGQHGKIGSLCKTETGEQQYATERYQCSLHDRPQAEILPLWKVYG